VKEFVVVRGFLAIQKN